MLRYSVDKSTAELLYLPISAGVKLQVKWFIDTVIWRMGDGLSGLIVLVFATFLQFSPRQISWIVLLLVSGWLMAVSVVRRQYVAARRQASPNIEWTWNKPPRQYWTVRPQSC